MVTAPPRNSKPPGGSSLAGAADFDGRRGFAAVDAFFDREGRAAATGAATRAPASSLSPASAAPARGLGRAGVGATALLPAPPTHSSAALGAVHRRLSKRQVREEEDVEDAEEEKKKKKREIRRGKAAATTKRGRSPSSSSSDDEEEELGRTALLGRERPPVTETKADALLPAGAALDPSTPEKYTKKRKKMGRKERQRAGGADDAGAAAAPDGAPPDPGERDIAQPGDDAPPPNPPNTSEPTEAQTKRRKSRPKKRSKQKNIAKDRRPAEARPSGRTLRPLTAATKAKLLRLHGVEGESKAASGGEAKESQASFPQAALRGAERSLGGDVEPLDTAPHFELDRATKGGAATSATKPGKKKPKYKNLIVS